MKIDPEDFDIGDGVKCPQCHGFDTYQYNTDEKEFSYDGTGYVHTDHTCKNCGKHFRLYTNFKYEITSQQTSD